MAKQSKSKKGKGDAAADGRGLRLRVMAKMALVLCLVAGIGAGIYLTGRFIVRSVVADRMFVVNPVRITLNLPDCVRGGIQQEIGFELSALQEMSIFEPRLPALVADRLRSSPWVLRVNRVERRLPNSLDLELEFRKPVGIVEAGDKRYLVDMYGYWLPSRYFKWPYDREPAVIVGEDIPDLPAKGQPWQSTAVRAGALMTQFLMASEQHLKGIRIARIDVSEFGRRRQTGRSCIVLHTADGVRINWGCSPLCSILPGLCRPAGELPDMEKLEGLVRVLRVRPGLSGIASVDVRFKTPVIVEKAPVEPAAVPAQTGAAPPR